MGSDRIFLSSIDLGDLLIVVRDHEPAGSGPWVATSPGDEAAALARFRERGDGRTMLLDDRISGELGVLLPRPLVDADPLPPVLVIHGEAGSANHLRTLLAELPEVVRAAVVVSYPHADWARRLTLSVLRRSSVLPVEELKGRTDLHPGVVYLAPPLGRTAELQVTDGQLVAFDVPVRPTVRDAADRLLVTAAAVTPTVSVLLTGIGPMPARGLRAVRLAGGHVLVHPASEEGLLASQAVAAGLADGDYDRDVLVALLEVVGSVPR